jgi:hypothetical protein
MGIFSNLPKACRAAGSIRAAARQLLKRAGRGESEAFLTLTEAYFNLVTEYLYLSNLDHAEAIARTEELFLTGWKRLPYMKKLGDWEHFLARSLMGVTVDPGQSTEGRRPRTLVDLEPQTKFALIAFDLENWSYKWLSLALDLEETDVRKILFRGRCRLLEIDIARKPRKTRHFLEQVSADLDGQVTPRQRQAILRKLCCSAEAKEFKSHWLDYRCHLIEMRQQIRLSPEAREEALQRIAARLSPEDMLRPTLFLRLRHLFGSAPPPDVRNLRFGDS